MTALFNLSFTFTLVHDFFFAFPPALLSFPSFFDGAPLAPFAFKASFALLVTPFLAAYNYQHKNFTISSYGSSLLIK